MIKVNFHHTREIGDDLLKYAVIAAKKDEKWIFCRHKERDTYEMPGGHREANERIDDTAKRELYEETGAISFDITTICVYSVTEGKDISYGMLFAADIRELSELPKDMEMAEIIMLDSLPDHMTYPFIQLCLHERAAEFYAKDGEKQGWR